MKHDGLVTVAVAVCCLFAISSAATTLDASVTTDPDEVVNTESVWLPIGTETAVELREDLERGEADDADDRTEREESDPPDEQENREEATADERDEDGSGSSVSDANEGSGGATDRQRSGTGSSGDAGFAGLGVVSGLFALLRRLLAALLALLPLVLLLLSIVLAVVHRDRLRSLLGAERPGTERIENETSVGEPDPSNEVARAWYGMIRTLELATDRTKTPREYANEAVDAGANPDAVSRLTAAFEQVRYGDAPVSEERTSLARRELDRIRDGGGRA